VKKYTPEEAIAAFWSKVDRSGGEDACWNWTGAVSGGGYGSFRWNGLSRRTHRISFELVNGPAPQGMYICHSCDNRLCVNPAHLWLGTNRDNLLDMMQKGRGGFLGGERHKYCKLSDLQIAEIRLRFASGGVTRHEIAAEYGMSRSYISMLLRNLKRS
jgi:hypothetical protein